MIMFLQVLRRDARVGQPWRGFLFSALLTAGLLVVWSAGLARSTAGTEEPTPVREPLRHQLAAFEQRLPPRPPDPVAQRHWARAHLHLRKARYAVDRYRLSPLVAGIIRDEVSFLADALAILEGTAEPELRKGEFEDAYWCELDGSAQPFVGYVPSAYDVLKPHPLLVYLHGYSPFLDIINWSELSPELLDVAEQGQFLVVAPFGRGNTDFQGIGEQDVLRVIEEMRRRYRVDDDRILLVGYSMGGMGAWTIAAHYPHLFAGALIVSGRACYYTWHGVRREDLPCYKRAYIDMEFGRSLLPNLLNLPILCYHGANDTLVPVNEIRTMITDLQPLNPALVYRELEGRDHWIFDQALRQPETRRWLEKQRRTRPETFTYVSWHPRYSQAHWLGLDGAFTPGTPRQVQVTVRDEHWLVSTTPPGAVRLYVDRLPPAVSPDLVRAESGTVLSIATENRTAQNYPSRGPLKEFFLAPFMFVQAGDTAADALAELRFEYRSRDWERYAQAPPRQTVESRLTDSDRADFNLMFFGEPETSPMIREILKQSPLSVTTDSYVVGGDLFAREDKGLLMVYRSPWQPGRLVAVQVGEPWGQNLSVNHRYDYVPDFIVYSSKPDADGSNRALAAGFFDHDWGIHAASLYRAAMESRK